LKYTNRYRTGHGRCAARLYTAAMSETIQTVNATVARQRSMSSTSDQLHDTGVLYVSSCTH